MEKFCKIGEDPDAGICRIPMYLVTSQSEGFSNTEWLSIVCGPRELSETDLRDLNNRNKRDYT